MVLTFFRLSVLGIILFLSLIAPLVSASEGAVSQLPKESAGYGCFRDASRTDVEKLMPLFAYDTVSQGIIDLMYCSLLNYDGVLKIVTDLSECWTISPDKRTVTFRLGEKVTWPDVKLLVGGNITDSWSVSPDSRTITLPLPEGVKWHGRIPFIGELAEKWDISPDNLTIVFHLRKNVNWHDGQPFTAQDVEFTYKVLRNEEFKTINNELYRHIKRAVALDKYTFEVTYSVPFAPALESWIIPILPEHLLENADLNKLAEDIPQHPRPDTIGTGPYKFCQRIPGKQIVLTRNDDYFGGKPGIEKYILYVIPNLSIQLSELKLGNLDRIKVSPIQYFTQSGNPSFIHRFHKDSHLAFSYHYLGYNHTRELFKDPLIRQALSHAINRQKIIDGVFLGLAAPATGPYIPGTFYHNPDIPAFGANPDEAKKLLAGKGWQPNSRGIIEKDSQPFKFTILTNQENEVRIRTAEIIQRQLRDVGVEVRIQTVRFDDLLKKVEKKDFDAVLLAEEQGLDPDQYASWHSKSEKLNFLGYSKQKADEFLDKGRDSLIPEERRNAYFAFQKLLAEDQPCTFLFYNYMLPVTHKRFQNIQYTAMGDHNFHKWYIRQSDQLKAEPNRSCPPP